MQPEERQMLERLLALSEQNNRILKKMRKSVVIGRILHMLYILFIIAISVVSYYYLKPYLSSLTTALGALDQLKALRY